MKKFIFVLILTVLLSCFSCFSTVSAYTPDFETKCKATLLINTDSDLVIYEKNADEKMYPASLTKIMTAVIAIENVKDLENTKVTAKAYIFDELYGLGGSTAGIYKGETFSMKDLLAALLIPSGNEAAMMIADYLGNGSIPAFVDKMNERAKELGMKNTHFVNPHGLHNDDHYTSARDLAILAKHAMELPVFKEIVSKTRYTLPATEIYNKERILVTTNQMIEPGTKYYYGSFGDKEIVTGVKTGYTESAGKCFVGTASKDGVNLLSISLGGNLGSSPQEGSNEAFEDTKKLFDWGFNKFTYKTIVKSSDRIKEIGVNMGQGTDSLILVPQSDVTAFIPTSVEIGSIKQVIESTPESINAPIKQGQAVGMLVLMLADQEIGRVPLVASESIEQSKLLLITSKIKAFVVSPIFITILIFIGLFVLFYIYMIIRINKKRKKVEYIGKRRRSKYVDDDEIDPRHRYRYSDNARSRDRYKHDNEYYDNDDEYYDDEY